MTRTRAGWLLKRAARQVWFRAALISLGSAVLAVLAGPAARWLPYEFTGNVGQEAADAVLQILATSMLTVTTFSLTAMVGAYSSATQIATPRATQLLISDRTSQKALSTFLGAFIFSVAGVIGIQTDLYGGQGRVVLLAATVAVIVLVVATLLRWIAHLTAFGRMADVIDRVEDAACEAMAAFAADPHGGGRPAVPIPAGAVPVPPRRTGYVTHLDTGVLARLAREHGVAIHVEALPGTLVHPGRPLVRIDGAAGGAVPPALDRSLRRAFTVERHRSFDHDPRLGLIALGEIAGRALSAAVNDPGTAIEVLNALLRTLSRLPAEEPAGADDPPPVYVPRPTPDELLRDGLTPVVRDGTAQEEVAVRLFKVLAALGDALPHARGTAEALAAELRANVERVMPEGAARARVLAAAPADG